MRENMNKVQFEVTEKSGKAPRNVPAGRAALNCSSFTCMEGTSFTEGDVTDFPARRKPPTAASRTPLWFGRMFGKRHICSAAAPEDRLPTAQPL